MRSRIQIASDLGRANTYLDKQLEELRSLTSRIQTQRRKIGRFTRELEKSDEERAAAHAAAKERAAQAWRTRRGVSSRRRAMRLEEAE